MEFPPLMAADIANDIYYLVTADNTGLGYESFYNLHEGYLELPEPPRLGKNTDYSTLPILKGTTGSFFSLNLKQVWG